MQRRIKERLVQGTRVRVYVPTRLPVPLRESVSIVRVEAGKHRPHCYSIPASILDFLEHFPEISSRPTNDRLDTAVDYGTRNNKRCCLFFFLRKYRYSHMWFFSSLCCLIWKILESILHFVFKIT